MTDMNAQFIDYNLNNPSTPHEEADKFNIIDKRHEEGKKLRKALQANFDAVTRDSFFNIVSLENVFGVSLRDGENAKNIDLFKIYLDAMPQEQRQHYNCACCATFVKRFSRLVTIDNNGRLNSVIYDDNIPEPYRSGFKAVAQVVEKLPVAISNGISTNKLVSLHADGENRYMAGWFNTDEWYHPSFEVFGDILSGEKAGELNNKETQHVTIMENVLDKYSLATIKKAAALIETESVPGYVDMQGPVKFLLDIATKVGLIKGKARTNLLYKFCKGASEGFFHINGSISGVLLNSIQDNKPMGVVYNKLKAFTAANKYKVPTEKPTDDELTRAKEDFIEFGKNYTDALKRTYAVMEDIKEKVWEPKKPPTAVSESFDDIFNTVKTKDTKQIEEILDVHTTISISRKAILDVIKAADKVEVWLDTSSRFPLVQFTTQAIDTAAPIILWDKEEQRNPVSWFTEHNGCLLRSFTQNASYYGWQEATCLVRKPSNWFLDEDKVTDENIHVLLLSGLKFMDNPTMALFPSILKAEFRDYRRVIEQYSVTNNLIDRNGDIATGMVVEMHEKIRVTKDNVRTVYQITTLK